MMIKKTLAKVYSPEDIEKRWSDHWIKENLFVADPFSKKPRFSMVIPPPNITGSLHLGHALNSTLQDIIARYKRMRGYNVLWLPGVDHAGIATQNVVEKKLKEEGLSRKELGRERFLERVWKWKDESEGAILNQLKKLGASCDWSRLRFTMDPGLTKAVREVFVRLYREGLIYRGDYIINFCPQCHTALSDLEVEHRETDSFLYHIEYPLKDGGSVTVATTRPETMLGDVAVAVNPEDGRYKNIIGKYAVLPLSGREIPVIEDSTVDMEFGTGVVKITPAHDFNDFEIAKRHPLLKPLKVMDEEARMNENAGRYRGLERYEARNIIIGDLKNSGLLKKEEKYKLPLGICYRCSTPVEPTLSKQWFVKTGPLAKPAIEAVEKGMTRFIPANWSATYFEWMRNIRDWCISRQIWWGHRIPAWHCKNCGHITVDTEDPKACQGCKSAEIFQDPDVLDTWFSSALWPFSTLGWPQKAPDDVFYPTSALFTSFDIIFFWIARMIMMGLKFKGDVPFKDVYIHALIRDAAGQKMSKSKGNVIDPLFMMEKYGTDALRFTLAAFAAQGRDIKLAEERIEGYRNFANKLWNLARFTLLNIEKEPPPSSPDGYTKADKWIITRLSFCTEEVIFALENYEFDRSARAIYYFIWHELCDWYVEMIKPDLRGEKGEDRKYASEAVLLSVLKDSLKILHPFMPFITEEVYSYLPGATPGIIKDGFAEASARYPLETDDVEALMEVIRAIRNIRTETNISPAVELDCTVFSEDRSLRDAIKDGEPYIKNLARVKNLHISEKGEKPAHAAFSLVRGKKGEAIEVFVPLKGHIDIEKETLRLSRELEKLEGDMEGVKKKLENKGFIGNAPIEIVEKEKERFSLLTEKKAKIAAGIERIRGIRENETEKKHPA